MYSNPLPKKEKSKKKIEFIFSAFSLIEQWIKARTRILYKDIVGWEV